MTLSPRGASAAAGLVVVAARLVVVSAGLVLVAVSCSSSPPPPIPQAPKNAHTSPADAGAPDGGPSLDDLRLAAFTKVIKETEPLLHDCWSKAAADDYQLSGRVVLAVTLGVEGMPSKVIVEQNSSGDTTLSSCLVARYGTHRWPPVFDAGTVVKVPLQFDAPRFQYTVRGDDVEPIEVAPGTLSVRALLHPRNTGNRAASMAMLTLSHGARVKMHRHTSAEVLLVMRGEGLLVDLRGEKHGRVVKPGTAVYVAAGVAHGFVQRGAAPTEVLQLYAPAGPEQRFVTGVDTSNSTRAVSVAEQRRGLRRKLPAANRPVVVTADSVDSLPIAGGKGSVKILFDAERVGNAAAYMGLLRLDKDAAVAKHLHAQSTELLYVLEGAGTMHVDALDYPVAAGTAIQVPANTPHAFAAAEGFSAVQFYTPSGPEQRFKAVAPARN